MADGIGTGGVIRFRRLGELLDQGSPNAGKAPPLAETGQPVPGKPEQAVIVGTPLGETLNGTADADTITGGGGNDIIRGFAGDDDLSGEDGNDTINAGDGNDIVFGGAGNDTLRGEAGNDSIDGGTGNDLIQGGDGDDFLYGSEGDDVIFGGEGRDIISGGDGDDTLRGENGDDQIWGGAGNDLLVGGDGSDSLDGHDGNDKIFGGAGGDFIYGGAGDDNLRGEAGDDEIHGGDGSDAILAGTGNDTVYGGQGSDRLYGEAGDDLMFGGTENDSLRGGAGNDELRGEEGNDILIGDAGADTLIGGDGADKIYGGDDNDYIEGGDGADILRGEAGDDILIAGSGNDTLLGGAGADWFVMSGSGTGELDRIKDFEQGQDLIVVRDTGFTTFAQLQAVMTTLGPNTIINLPTGGRILIENILPGDLTANDFVLEQYDTPNILSSPTATFAENGTMPAYSIAATDRTQDALTYGVSGTDGALFTVDANGFVSFLAPPDFETPLDAGGDNVYNITVTAFDGFYTASLNVAITVTNVNDNAPVFTSGTSVSVQENATYTVYTAVAPDADGDVVTYSLTGVDAALFSINETTGAVTFITPPDHEAPADAGADNVYNFTVTATDGTFSTDRDVALTVLNQNDNAPVFTSASSLTVPENTAGTVYTAVATDADPGGTITYLIAGGTDAGDFTINTSTGAVSFSNGPPDFEYPADANADNVYTFTVRAWDGIFATDFSVTITVEDVYDVLDPIHVDLSFLTPSIISPAPVLGFVIQGDAAGDWAGRSVSSAGDVNGDGFDDLIIGAPFGGDGGSQSGEAYVVFGSASGFGANIGGRQVIDLTGLSAVQGFIIQGDEAGDRAGWAVSSAGDVNGDGFSDIIINAFEGDDGGANVGEAYIIFGSADGFGTDVGGRQVIDLTTLSASEGFIVVPDTNTQQSAFSVSSAGDVNGDGLDDFMIGARFAGSGGEGLVFVVFGSEDTFGSDIAGRQVFDLADLVTGRGFTIQGDASSDFAGSSVRNAGDVNGDGFDDLIVGAHNGGDGGGQAGEAYIVFGTATGFGATVGGRQVIDLTTLTAAQGFIIQGDAATDLAGYSVSSAGDINGDGFADLLIGAPGGDDGGTGAGEAYVVFGSAAGFGVDVGGRQVIDLTTLTAAQGFIIQGDAATDLAGYSVSSAGDVNGDGLDDILVGANGADFGGSNSGAAYVIFGTTSLVGSDVAGRQVLDLSSLTLDEGFIIFGDTLSDSAGRSVSSAGDVNDDGFDDILVGAYRGDDGGTDAGEAYVIYGNSWNVHTQGDTFTGSAGADQLHGTAGNDTLIGSGGADTLRSGAGNDRIEISDMGFLAVHGGRGTDTLALTGSGLTLDMTTTPRPRVDSVEIVELTGTGDNTLVLNRLAVQNLTEVREGGAATVRVTGNAGDSVSLTDAGWTQGSNVTEGALTYASYTNGNARVLVQLGVGVSGIGLAEPPPDPGKAQIFEVAGSNADGGVMHSAAAAGAITLVHLLERLNYLEQSFDFSRLGRGEAALRDAVQDSGGYPSRVYIADSASFDWTGLGLPETDGFLPDQSLARGVDVWDL